MLDLHNIVIRYGNNTVVNGLSFSLREGEIGCLLGPSGCGKTSTLRAIAGFEGLQGGSVSLRQQQVSSPGAMVDPEMRHVGVVFQDFALFPHMTVSENLGYGLHTWRTEQKAERIEQVLALVGLEPMAARYPHQLSGGQQQRVALARALAPKPDLLLLDEPFSSLDAELRSSLAADIRDIIKHENITALMVTHDQHEAFAMADNIGVMSGGELHQWDNAYGLYHNPQTRFVADFIGSGVFVEAVATANETVLTPLGELSYSERQTIADGARLSLLVRPDDIVHDDASDYAAKVVSRSFQGSHILYGLELMGENKVPLLCLAPSHHNHPIGSDFGIRLDLQHLILF